MIRDGFPEFAARFRQEDTVRERCQELLVSRRWLCGTVKHNPSTNQYLVK